MQQTIVDDLRDLMAKEETILYPTSLALIPAAEFEQMKAGDREIGYAWGQTAQQAEPVKAAPEAKAADGDLAADLAALLAKYGHKTASPLSRRLMSAPETSRSIRSISSIGTSARRHHLCR